MLTPLTNDDMKSSKKDTCGINVIPVLHLCLGVHDKVAVHESHLQLLRHWFVY